MGKKTTIVGFFPLSFLTIISCAVLANKHFDIVRLRCVLSYNMQQVVC